MSSKYDPFKDVQRRKYRYRKPNAISGVLKYALKKRGLNPDIDRYHYVLHWSEIVGDKLAEIIKPGFLRGNSLVIEAPNSMWAQELSFKKLEILEAIQPYLSKDQVISDVAFEIAKN